MPSFHFVAVAHCVGLMKPNAAGGKRVPAHNAHMWSAEYSIEVNLTLLQVDLISFVSRYSLDLQKSQKNVTSERHFNLCHFCFM